MLRSAAASHTRLLASSSSVSTLVGAPITHASSTPSSSAAASNVAAATVCCAASASSSSSTAFSRRRLHTSSLSLLKRHVDGDWLPENRQKKDRPSHFDPPAPGPIVTHEKPLFKEYRQHEKITPRVVPPIGTHTNANMRHDIRMQFQLEPVSRTQVKGYPNAQGKRILDYTRNEVYTRAPWPCYREIIINRPAQHHVLNPAMIQQLNHLTQSIEENKDITAVILTSRHLPTADERPADFKVAPDRETGMKRKPYEKTFSAGMDLHTLVTILREAREKRVKGEVASSSNNGHAELSKYFRSLYSLAWNIHKIRTPIVVVVDGLAVGAGAGFALQARFRCATENTRISFPQASLGWFPDAGASYILPRLDGKLGLFMALTGWTVRGLDATRLNLCSHYCESDEIHRFGYRIGDSSLNYQFAEDTIEQSFGMFNTSGPSFLPLPIHDLHEVINDLFSGDSVEAILTKMTQRIEETRAKGAAATQKEQATTSFIIEMQKRMIASSPVGLKATFELLRLTQFLPLEKCIRLEYRLAQNLLCNVPNPLAAELFNAPKFALRTLAQVTPEMIKAWFTENPDETKELMVTYPKKKVPQWYI